MEELDNVPEYIWIRTSGYDKFIFPLEQGLEFIRSISGCLLFEAAYNATPTIKRQTEDYSFGFLSRSEIQEIIAAQELLGEVND
jgi:hypothetical protein